MVGWHGVVEWRERRRSGGFLDRKDAAPNGSSDLPASGCESKSNVKIRARFMAKYTSTWLPLTKMVNLLCASH